MLLMCHGVQFWIRVVESFPDDIGEWKFVESREDFTIQFVDIFRSHFLGRTGSSMTEEEWNAVLDKIIWAFEEIAGDEPNDPRLAVMGEMLDAFPNAWEDERLEDGSCKSWLSKDAQAFLDAREEETAKAYDAYKARIEEGKQLFVKYIGALWD
ncbi:hypothetical protein [Selenomonas sp. KH1T6]|uniref:hypothetical protein n=1 Tax=Selenomonas sp. KH1T6 TaxID=3158784 RepID=UPI0008A78369|nr:hypothetical protein SAMN05216583_15411 [Selenomonas ruminantium]